jgi:chitin disaccharide deacetylase
MPVRIIVNADDLGYSEEVNDAIFRGIERAVVTSATMLSNGPAVRPAAQMLHLYPKCSFGVHLNLSEFEPVRAESRSGLASILDGNSHFNGNSIREAPMSPALIRAIFQEWCAQIENLIRLGVEPSHLDAHHHVHTIPQLFPVLIALRRRYKINRIRISRNMYDDVERPADLVLAEKWLYNLALRMVGFRTTRIFTNLITYVKLCTVQPPRFASIELMTHPRSLPHDEEVNLLESDWLRSLAYQATLVSYNSL